MFGFLDVLDRHAAERKRLRHEQKQRATELCRRYLLVTNSTLACTRRRRRPRRRVFGWRTGTAVLARQAWWDQCEEECAAGISPYRGTKKREVGR